jgi:hypothetical protein
VGAGAVALGLAVVGMVAGCGGTNGGGGPAAAASGGAGGFQAYAECLRQHGVNISVPSGRPSGFRPSDRPSGVRPSGSRPSRGPGGGFPGFGGGPPSGVDQATWEAAQQACASVRPSFGGGGRNNGAFTAYRNCLSDHGISASAGPDQLNTADPKVAAALAACAPLRPSGRPSPVPSAS